MPIFNLLILQSFLFLSTIAPLFLAAQESNPSLIPTEEIRIRDPFIYADSSSRLYYMYAQIDNRLSGKGGPDRPKGVEVDRKSTRLNSSHVASSYAVFCLIKITK